MSKSTTKGEEMEGAWELRPDGTYVEEIVHLTRHICTECGAAYHSDEKVATICNKCTLNKPVSWNPPPGYGSQL
jgi:hypothetical protein